MYDATTDVSSPYSIAVQYALESSEMLFSNNGVALFTNPNKNG